MWNALAAKKAAKRQRGSIMKPSVHTLEHSRVCNNRNEQGPLNVNHKRERAPNFVDIIIRIMHVMRKTGKRKNLFFEIPAFWLFSASPMNLYFLHISSVETCMLSFLLSFISVSGRSILLRCRFIFGSLQYIS